MLCAPYKRSFDILQQNWTFSTKGQKLQILCVWQKRTGEVKGHLLVSYVLIIAASEKMDYPRKWTTYYKGRKWALNVLCQPDQRKSWPQLPSVWVAGTQAASQSAWHSPCTLPNILAVTAAILQCYREAHWRMWDSVSFGKCEFADSFKHIARCLSRTVLIQKRYPLHRSLHKQNNILPPTENKTVIQ